MLPLEGVACSSARSLEVVVVQLALEGVVSYLACDVVHCLVVACVTGGSRELQWKEAGGRASPASCPWREW